MTIFLKNITEKKLLKLNFRIAIKRNYIYGFNRVAFGALSSSAIFSYKALPSNLQALTNGLAMLNNPFANNVLNQMELGVGLNKIISNYNGVNFYRDADVHAAFLDFFMKGKYFPNDFKFLSSHPMFIFYHEILGAHVANVASHSDNSLNVKSITTEFLQRRNQTATFISNYDFNGKKLDQFLWDLYHTFDPSIINSARPVFKNQKDEEGYVAGASTFLAQSLYEKWEQAVGRIGLINIYTDPVTKLITYTTIDGKYCGYSKIEAIKSIIVSMSVAKEIKQNYGANLTSDEILNIMLRMPQDRYDTAYRTMRQTLMHELQTLFGASHTNVNKSLPTGISADTLRPALIEILLKDKLRDVTQPSANSFNQTIQNLKQQMIDRAKIPTLTEEISKIK